MFPTHGTQSMAQMALIFIKGHVGIEKSLLIDTVAKETKYLLSSTDQTALRMYM